MKFGVQSWLIGGLAIACVAMGFFLVREDTSVPKPVSDSPTLIAKAAVSPEFNPTTELALQNFSKIQTKMDQPERDGLSATTRLMMEILDNPNKVQRQIDLANILQNVTAENWKDVRDGFMLQAREHGRHHHLEWPIFLQRAGEVAGEEVVEEMFPQKRSGGTYAALTGWAFSDPDAALQWVKNLENVDFRDGIWVGMVQGIAQADPERALLFIGTTSC
ncbi:MAG: hypothetical protein ACKVJU_05565 [Verrucomicrobiales bacterium]